MKKTKKKVKKVKYIRVKGYYNICNLPVGYDEKGNVSYAIFKVI
jgi:hypothetical protein